MLPFLKLVILAPFYLVFTHDSDWEHKTIIPIYSSMQSCNEQAQTVDAIMQNRTPMSIGKFISQNNPHAFCIATGWTPQSTGGQVIGTAINDEVQPALTGNAH